MLSTEETRMKEDEDAGEKVETLEAKTELVNDVIHLNDMSEFTAAESPSIISWGRSDFGGLLTRRGNEDCKNGFSLYQILGRSIVSISSNVYHTAAVSATGELFTCGQNDQGQVSDDVSVEEIGKPRILESLSNHRIVSAACGLYHTCVVTASGCAVSFGGNENGQLGHSAEKIAKVGPKVVNFILPPRRVPLVICKVACGDLFSLFLTTSGEVYGCGSSAFLGNPIRGNHLIVAQAERIEALVGSNIVSIAAGSSHALALTRAGDLYAWGSNRHRELGFETSLNRDGECHEQIPKSVLNSKDMSQAIGISAGYSHSVMWTSRGLLFGAGNNKYGQLGILLPRASNFTLIELPNFCTMAACGSNHTVVLCTDQPPLATVVPAVGMPLAGESLIRVPSLTSSVSSSSMSIDDAIMSRGLNGTKVYGFGANSMNQVKPSLDSTTMYRLPVELSPDLAQSWAVSEVLYVGAGGDHSFVIASTFSMAEANSSSADGHLLRKQFSSLVSKAVLPMTANQLQSLIDKAHGDSEKMLPLCLSTVTEIFSSPSLLAASFSVPNQSRDAIDVQGLEEFYVSLLRLHSSALPRLLGAIQQAVTEMESALHSANRLNEASVRVFAILWQAPLMGEFVLTTDILLRLARLVYRHRRSFRRYMLLHGSQQYPDHIFVTRLIRPILNHLEAHVTANQDLFTSRFQNSLAQNSSELDNVSLLCKVLHVLYMSTNQPTSSSISTAELIYNEISKSELRSATGLSLSLPPEAFHSAALSRLSDAALVMDFIHWRDISHRRKNGTLTVPIPDEENEDAYPLVSSSYFYICSFPYLLTVDAKRRVILAEALLHQQAAQRQAVTQGILLHGGIVMPWFVISIERAHLLQQTLIHIQNATPLDIKKPLKVVFIGEEGIDEGGVKKEFFQLLIVQLFDLSYGMFVPNATGRHLWINSGNVWSENEYRLVGSILALAVYNNVILDTHLPPIFYKKLLQQLPTSLEDLQGLDPELYKGLKMLLEFPQPELVEDTFCRTFSVEYEVFDSKVIHDLIPDGRNIPVRGDNREMFVEKYVHWLLEESVQAQFQSLREGFSLVIPPEQLLLLSPGDLELLIAGMPHLDFRELESNTEYIGDSTWTAENPTVTWFWQILHSFSLDDKQRFLKFVTGSHKAPVGGLKVLGLKIQRAGPDSNSLPTAHTCFNTLLLPEYSNAEKLRDRLSTAINECEGFGLK